MVSRKFVENLKANITKELGDYLADEPRVRTFGSKVDQYKGLGDDLKTKFIPFRSSKYEAQEFLFARIMVHDDNISFFDFITPILNIKGKSVQGIGTFLTYGASPIPETYIRKMVGLNYRLVPHEWVVNQEYSAKEIIKNNWIDNEAILGIHEDKQLCNKLSGNSSTKVKKYTFSKEYYKVKFDYLKHPHSDFAIIPYRGNSILISRDTGDWGCVVDYPLYPFLQRFQAFSGVASYLEAYPDDGGEEGVEIGEFYMDPMLEITLPPLLRFLDQQ